MSAWLRGMGMLLVSALAGRAAPDRAWALIPVALINPENGIAGGGKFLHRAFLGADDLDFQVYGTSRGQAEAKLEHRRLHWAGSDWRSREEAEAFYYPESWFGGGNRPRDEDEQIYTPLGGRGEIEVGHPLGAGFLARAMWQVRHVEMRDMPAPGGPGTPPTPLAPELPGYGGGWDDLAGLSLELDTRDDERLPSRGWHAGHRFAHSLARIDYSYGWIETWLARYANPWPAWELAAKGFQKTAVGRAPFYAWPYLGDKRLLRGIPEKRLRDRSAQALQAELRWSFRLALPLVARFFGDTWQMAAFAGAGRVGADFATASREEIHVAGGAGGRLLIGNRLGALRGDLAVSRFGYGLYVDFNQAF